MDIDYGLIHSVSRDFTFSFSESVWHTSYGSHHSLSLHYHSFYKYTAPQVNRRRFRLLMPECNHESPGDRTPRVENTSLKQELVVC